VLQQALWYCCSLRLAVLFDAPLEVKERIVAEGQAFADNAMSISYGTEWQFFKALHLMRVDSRDPRIQEVRDHLFTMPLSKSCPVTNRDWADVQMLITPSPSRSLIALALYVTICSRA
jgi:hypothetical protein